MRNTEKETISLDYGTSELSVRVRDDVVSLGHQEPLDLVDPQKFKDNLLIILKKMEKPRLTRFRRALLTGWKGI